MLQNINPTVVIALITAIAAIMAPVITKSLESKHQRKMKHMEIMLAKKIQVYEAFVQSASQYVYSNSPNGPEYKIFLDSYHSVLLLSDLTSRHLLEEFAEATNTLRLLQSDLAKADFIQNQWYKTFSNVCLSLSIELDLCK